MFLRKEKREKNRQSVEIKVHYKSRKKKVKSELKHTYHTTRKRLPTALFGLSPTLLILSVVGVFWILDNATIEPSLDILSLLIVAASFSFPLMINVLMDRKIERKDIVVSLIVSALGLAILSSSLGLTLGKNSLFAGMMLGGITLLGFIMLILSVFALGAYMAYKRRRI